MAGIGDGLVERAGNLARDAACERLGESLRGFADEKCLADAREQRRQAGDALFLRLSAGDPVDVGVAGERLFRRVGVGRLAVVDVTHAVDLGDQLLAVRQAGEALDAGDRGCLVETEGAGCGVGGGRVLSVMPSGQMRRLGEVEHRPGLAVEIVDQFSVLDIDAARGRGVGRDRHRLLPSGGFERGENAAADLVVDADDGAVRGSLVAEDALLGLDIARHAAVAAEMVGRDVQQHCDVERQAAGEFELIGAQLQHVNPVLAQRLEQQRGEAQIAAHRDLAPGLLEDMGDQRGGGRFAVGAGDAGEARFLAGERQQLDVADDRQSRLARQLGDRMRLGIGVRNAGRQHQRLGVRQAVPQKIGQGQPGILRGLALVGRVVPGQHARAAQLQRLGRRQARARQPQHGHGLIAEIRHRDHRLTSASAW